MLTWIFGPKYKLITNGRIYGIRCTRGLWRGHFFSFIDCFWCKDKDSSSWTFDKATAELWLRRLNA